MSLFENISKKVSETAKAAAKKSGDIVEVTKLNMNIGAEEDKIKKVYSDIGKIIFDVYEKGEDVGDELKEQCEKIIAFKANIAEMKEKIFELKKVKICTSCGAELEIESAFCSKCGAKQTVQKCDGCAACEAEQQESGE